MRILFLIVLFAIPLIAQANKTGGKYLPAEGHFHALFLFVQFPDDKYSPDNSNWKLNQPPEYMNIFVDESESDISHTANISSYFDDMSLGKFKFTGRSVYLKTPQTREWYYKNKKSRAFINADIIKKADEDIDFSEFDNWKRFGDFTYEEESDSVVDMVFIIFRNVGNDLHDTLKRKMENQFGLVPGGEASLGYGSHINVDNNERMVQMGFPGSGVNVKANLNQIAISGCAHEFGHYLIGGNEAHFINGMYGLMSSWGFTQRSIMMNGWERLKLGWVSPKEFGPENETYRNVKLRDYLTTGEIIKINIPGSKEYFLLENHQLINKNWDVPDQSGGDVKGIYVLRQSGNSGSTLTLISADGRWTWEVTEKVPNPYGGTDSLPVFSKVEADPDKGNFDNEMIPYKNNGAYKSEVIHFYKDEKGKIVEKAVFRGDGEDHFDLNRNEFSEDTNPSSVLSNKKPSGVSFIIKSSERERDGSETFILDITIK